MSGRRKAWTFAVVLLGVDLGIAGLSPSPTHWIAAGAAGLTVVALVGLLTVAGKF